MKKNNKGFVLIELLIVAVFTASLFTFLYVNVVPLMGDYEQKEKYDTLDTKYVLYDLRKEILTLDENEEDAVWDTIKKEVKEKGFSRLYEYDGSNIKCRSDLFKTHTAATTDEMVLENNQTNNCNFLIRSYSIKSLYITRFGMGDYAEGTEIDREYKNMKTIAKSGALKTEYTHKDALTYPAVETEEYIKKMKNYTLGYELKKEYYRIIACMYLVDRSDTYCGSIELIRK